VIPKYSWGGAMKNGAHAPEELSIYPERKSTRKCKK
jgi:hypothetical protein